MSEAKVIEEKEIMTMAQAARDKVARIFLHWTGGHYGVNEDAYHLCVDKDGQVYANCSEFTEKKAHTWLRNSGSMAVSLLCGCDGNCWPPGNGKGIRACHKQGQRADTLRNCLERPLRPRQRGSVFQMGSVVPAGLYPRRGIDSRRRVAAGKGAVLPA